MVAASKAVKGPKNPTRETIERKSALMLALGRLLEEWIWVFKLDKKVNRQRLPKRVSYRKSTGQGNPVFPTATLQSPRNLLETSVAHVQRRRSSSKFLHICLTSSDLFLDFNPMSIVTFRPY